MSIGMIVQRKRIRARRHGSRRSPASASGCVIGMVCLALAVTPSATAATQNCRPRPGGANKPIGLLDRLDRLMKLGVKHGGTCPRPDASAPQSDETTRPGSSDGLPPPPKQGVDPSVRRGLPLQNPSLSAQRAANVFARDENQAVLARGHPEWDPIGVREGAFIFLPSLQVQAVYTDNAFATAGNPRSDGYLVLQPGLNVESDWNENAISLQAGGNIERYATYRTLNNNGYSVIGSGVLNIHHDLTVTGEVVQARTLIPQIADSYSQITITQLAYDETLLNVKATQTYNYLKLSATGEIARVEYANGLTPSGQVLDQSYQNRTSYLGTFRADVALSENTAFFVQEAVSHSVLESYLRDHDETETLAGPNFQIARLVTAELGLGYLTSTYANTLAKPVGNFTGRGTISYFPSELLTLQLTARQMVIDSGIVASPAYLSRQAEIEGDYELLRNLVIIGRLAGVWNKYQIIDRHDFDIAATVQAKYLVSHGLALAVSFTRQQRLSRGAAAGPGFDQDVAMIGVTVQR
jgi:hypothetical protein